MTSLAQIYAQLRQFGLDPRDWRLSYLPQVVENKAQVISLELVHRDEQEFKMHGSMADGQLFSLEIA